MADPSLFRLRVWFQKRGRAVMLAHLEVARTIEREIRRAQLPFAITHGFSPHMRISLGSALPVGVGGTRECFDVFLTSYIDPDEAMKRFAGACAEDLAIVDCKYIAAHDPSVSVAYPFSDYLVTLTRPLATEISVPNTVCIKRKNKQRTLHVADFLVGTINVAEDAKALTFTTKAQESGATLRPDIFTRALLAGQWDDIDALCADENNVLGIGHMAFAVSSITRTNQRMI